MSEAKKVYRCLKLVEYTSLPLTLLILLYLLSGYGTVSLIPSAVGFTYTTSIKIHTLPLLRYLLAVITALHLYGGAVVIAHRRVRYKKLATTVKAAGLAAALLVAALATVSEVHAILRW